jgi:hypothetical protein
LPGAEAENEDENRKYSQTNCECVGTWFLHLNLSKTALWTNGIIGVKTSIKTETKSCRKSARRLFPEILCTKISCLSRKTKNMRVLFLLDPSKKTKSLFLMKYMLWLKISQNMSMAQNFEACGSP